MGFKSYNAHYLNKFPGSQVSYNEQSLDVFRDGEHLVHLEKDGMGMIQDRSDEQGCSAKHDLAPIPKNTRAHKLYPDGKLGKAEEHGERSETGYKLASMFGGCVPSIAELKAKGFSVCDKGNVSMPAEKAAPAAAEKKEDPKPSAGAQDAPPAA